MSRRSRSRCRSGPVTRNPFLNFLREYRMKNKCKPAIQQTREAAKQWHKLSCKVKSRYIVQAFYARKVYRRRSNSARHGRKSASGRNRRNRRRGRNLKRRC